MQGLRRSRKKEERDLRTEEDQMISDRRRQPKPIEMGVTTAISRRSKELRGRHSLRKVGALNSLHFSCAWEPQKFEYRKSAHAPVSPTDSTTLRYGMDAY